MQIKLVVVIWGIFPIAFFSQDNQEQVVVLDTWVIQVSKQKYIFSFFTCETSLLYIGRDLGNTRGARVAPLSSLRVLDIEWALDGTPAFPFRRQFFFVIQLYQFCKQNYWSHACIIRTCGFGWILLTVPANNYVLLLFFLFYSNGLTSF